MADHYQEIPYPARVMHWVHLVAIFSLAFTGICIRHHFFERYIVIQRRHHYYFMYVILINLIFRMIYAFWDKTKTYKDFALTMADIKNTPNVLQYYLFLKNDYPHVAKYASLQKISYNFFWILTIIQGYIGFAILEPGLFLGLLGNKEATIVWSRGLHAAGMWFFIIMTTIHIYIAIIEGYPLLKLMLFGIEPDES
jgi:Ni,Fe-hydrogenase I cytochrome b subunit